MPSWGTNFENFVIPLQENKHIIIPCRILKSKGSGQGKVARIGK